MKQNIILTLNTIPSAMRDATLLAKVLITLAGAISVFGIIFALSRVESKNRTRVFISDGAAIHADRERGVHWDDVRAAYPYKDAAAPGNENDIQN